MYYGREQLTTVLSFLYFFVQMSNVTTEYCLDIIQKFEVSEENKEQNVLGIEGKSYLILVKKIRK